MHFQLRAGLIKLLSVRSGCERPGIYLWQELSQERKDQLRVVNVTNLTGGQCDSRKSGDKGEANDKPKTEPTSFLFCKHWLIGCAAAHLAGVQVRWRPSGTALSFHRMIPGDCQAWWPAPFLVEPSRRPITQILKQKVKDAEQQQPRYMKPPQSRQSLR